VPARTVSFRFQRALSFAAPSTGIGAGQVQAAVVLRNSGSGCYPVHAAKHAVTARCTARNTRVRVPLHERVYPN
jgi:hypothetical protein